MSNPKTIDSTLKQWATPTQAKYIDAVIEHGSLRAAAKSIGVHFSALGRSISAVEKKARLHGYDPENNMTRPALDPFYVKGTSTLFDADGNVSAQWVKTAINQERSFELAKEAIAELSSDVKRERPVSSPKIAEADLCNLYTMTDCHMGMLAWGKETGADWDLKIAESVLTRCFKAMVDGSPNAKTCIINQLGDFLHTDGMEPLTPTGGNVLDSDGRFSKIVAATIRVLRELVRMALKKHEIVHVIMAEGNHDIVSSIWLRQLFKAMFENEPRVIVNDSEVPYYVHQHGNVMLAFHHGHKKKLNELPLMFAAHAPEIWGSTKYRYGHSGHMHNQKELIAEYNGMKWRQHPTLAAPDAYSARGGWISKREAEAITYHSKYGQVGSVTVTPEMVGY